MRRLQLLFLPAIVSGLSENFAGLGLSPSLARAAALKGWTAPTSIQQQAIPLLLDGENVWAEAPTGSGKTAAFALPLLERLLRLDDDGNDGDGAKVIAVPRRRTTLSLVLSPTRELAVQTGRVFRELATCMHEENAQLRLAGGGASDSGSSDGGIEVAVPRNLRTCVLHGGVSINPQLRQLSGGVDVLVATPGRLLDVVASSGVSLDNVRILVLDEADRLFSPAFAEELDMVLDMLPSGHDDDDDDNEDDERDSESDRSRGSGSSRSSPLQASIFSATFPYRARARARQLFRSRGLLGARLGSAPVVMVNGDHDGGGGGGGGGGGEGGQVLELEGYLDEDEERDASGSGVTKRERYAVSPVVSTIKQRAILVDERDRTRLLQHLAEQRVAVSTEEEEEEVEEDDIDDMGFAQLAALMEDVGGPELSAEASLEEARDAVWRFVEQSFSDAHDHDHDHDGHIEFEEFEEEEEEAVLEEEAKAVEVAGGGGKGKGKGKLRWGRVLCFVATQHTAERVARKLAGRGVACSALHGGLSQDVRAARLAAFERKDDDDTDDDDTDEEDVARVLVATDVAARGLDMAGLPLVVNYDLPRSTADYTHRVGRTGRAGQKGEAVSFVTAANAAHFALIEERHSGAQQRQHSDGTASAAVIEREVMPGFEPKDEVNELSSARSRARQPQQPQQQQQQQQQQQHAPSHDQDPSDGVGSVVIEGVVPGVQHSQLGLAHDKMMGGVKGRRKSKKDKLREAAAAKKAAEEAG